MRSRSVGSSLGEVLVSFGILMPVMVVLVGLFPVSHLWNHRAWKVAAAHDLALHRLETLRAMPFDEVPATSTETAERQGTPFRTTTRATLREPKQGIPLKRVVVTVTWGSESLTYETLLARVAR